MRFLNKLDTWVKPEFPKLFALVSVWVVTPLLLIFMIVSVQHGIDRPATEMLPLGLSAFGVTAALSGVSFSMARANTNPDTTYYAGYAGEKFLHSAILLIQSLVVLYVRDTVVEIDWVKTWPWLNLVTTVKLVAHSILFIVTAAATWSWYYGYSELNGVLWKNWEQRILNINAARMKKETVVPVKADKDEPGEN